MRIETLLGEKSSSVIIPESDYNWGLEDIAGKMKRFLGKAVKSTIPDCRSKDKIISNSKITKWPTNSENVQCAKQQKRRIILQSVVIGTFNDSFNISTNQEIIQKWFLSRWQVSVGLRVTPINHNKLLFELPSKQEAVRVKNGDWFWNGRRLTLDWRSPAGESEVTLRDAG